MSAPSHAVLNRAMAARLAARAEIRDIRMLKSSFRLKAVPDDGDQLAYQLTVNQNTVDRDAQDTFFMLRVDYALDLERRFRDADGEVSTTKIAKLRFTLSGLFDLNMRDGDDEPTEDEFAAYAATTGAFALYPFAREYVYDVTGRLRLPPLTLGVSTQVITKEEVARPQALTN